MAFTRFFLLYNSNYALCEQHIAYNSLSCLTFHLLGVTCTSYLECMTNWFHWSEYILASVVACGLYISIASKRPNS